MGSTVLRRYRYERHPDNYQYVTHMQSEVLRNMRLIARSPSQMQRLGKTQSMVERILKKCICRSLNDHRAKDIDARPRDRIQCSAQYYLKQSPEIISLAVVHRQQLCYYKTTIPEAFNYYIGMNRY